MKLTILGSGTSTGVPIIGCTCSVCTSPDERNRRTRSSLLVTTEGAEGAGARQLIIDTSTDLRIQSLSHGLKHLDGVLFTHPHADHIHGIDDLRAFNMSMKGSIPIYGNAHTIERIKVMFDYIFDEDGGESWRPDLEANVVDGPFTVAGLDVTPVEIYHGRELIYGYRMGGAAYLTDCSSIPGGSLERLRGLDVLILGALRHKPHPTHMSIEEAVRMAERLKPGRTVLTHLSHNIDFEKDSDRLPDGVELAYDGLVIGL